MCSHFIFLHFSQFYFFAICKKLFKLFFDTPRGYMAFVCEDMIYEVK